MMLYRINAKYEQKHLLSGTEIFDRFLLSNTGKVKMLAIHETVEYISTNIGNNA